MTSDKGVVVLCHGCATPWMLGKRPTKTWYCHECRYEQSRFPYTEMPALPPARVAALIGCILAMIAIGFAAAYLIIVHKP